MKKKIALLISHLHSGGAQRVVSNLSEGLSEKYSIHLLLHDAQTINYPFNGTIIDLKTPSSTSTLLRLKNFIKRIYVVYTIKTKHKYSASISFLESSNIINLLTGRNGKTIVSVRSHKSLASVGLIGAIYSLMIKLFYNKCDFIVAVSEGVKHDLVSNYGLNREKIRVIYNPFNLNFIKTQCIEKIDKELEPLFLKPVLITVGSLSYPKGHYNLLRAFKIINSKTPELQLIILGSGELEEDLKKFASKLNISTSVEFLGFHANPFKYISRSSIFVLSSLYEGFPNVLVEAMACGIPVISTDCQSGPGEILADRKAGNGQVKNIDYADYGILVPVFSNSYSDADTPYSKEEEMLASGVVELWQNKEMYNHYKFKGLERANDFNSSTIVEEWVGLIE